MQIVISLGIMLILFAAVEPDPWSLQYWEIIIGSALLGIGIAVAINRLENKK